MQNTFITEFINQSILRIQESSHRIEICLLEINETEVWKYSNSNLNSIGTIILHLCGNIRQYIISGLGNAMDVRERDKEFSAKDGYTKTELLGKLVATVDEAIVVIKNINEEELSKTYSVQGYNLSGIGIIIHVTEHYSYHTGQVALLTKEMKNKDLGFYANIDLNTKNKN